MFCWCRILRPLGVVFGNSGQSKVRCSRIDCGHPRQASGQFSHNALMTASGTDQLLARCNGLTSLRSESRYVADGVQGQKRRPEPTGAASWFAISCCTSALDR